MMPLIHAWLLEPVSASVPQGPDLVPCSCCARDLKLDNTLLANGTPPMIKLCDFGFAKAWENHEDANMHTHIG
jgi:serine/threonine protein kinase